MIWLLRLLAVTGALIVAHSMYLRGRLDMWAFIRKRDAWRNALVAHKLGDPVPDYPEPKVSWPEMLVSIAMVAFWAVMALWIGAAK